MLFWKKKIEIEKKDEKDIIDFILPLYLNQRFVYDILAIINGGFTDFFEIKDKKENSDESYATVSANFGSNNDFSLIQAGINSEIKSRMFNDSNNEKTYKKTHTPTSLFMQVYQFLKNNNKIISLNKSEDIKNIKSGDFIELKSIIELNTIIEFFETLNKAIDITEAFSDFATIGSKNSIKNSPLSLMKKPVEKTIKAIGNENSNIKYGTCKLGGKDLVIKLNKAYFINSDYSEIKNGEFRIIGKVLEIVPDGQVVLLNRENAVGLYDPATFDPVKESLNSIPNVHFKEFQDAVEGETIVIMPISIGI